MFEADEDGVYARIAIAPARFFFAFVVQILLGLVLIYMAFNSAAGVVGKVLIIALGVGMLVQANRLRGSLKDEVWLTDAGLVTNEGLMLAPLDQIKEVSRGAFALKPSNGFSVVLDEKLGFLWVPGLWWRKFMAEQISYKIAERG